MYAPAAANNVLTVEPLAALSVPSHSLNATSNSPIYPLIGITLISAVEPNSKANADDAEESVNQSLSLDNNLYLITAFDVEGIFTMAIPEAIWIRASLKSLPTCVRTLDTVLDDTNCSVIPSLTVAIVYIR